MANEFIIKNGFISNGNGVVQGDLNVTGNTTFGSLSATTISATTYQNLPVDPDTYITGFTYSANTFTISDTSGNTYNATINSVTGLTVNGNLTITGDTTSDSFSGNTFSGGTFIGDGSQLNLGQPTVASRLYLYNNYY
jgi:hypothetical protein